MCTLSGLVRLSQCLQSQSPERFGDGVQPAVEAALGQGPDVSVAAQEVQGRLLVAREELGGNGGQGHDLGRRKSGLGVIVMSEGFEQFIEKTVQSYNLLRHGRLWDKGGLDNRTLPEACPVQSR
jgi:hypothetical protein